MHKQPGIYTVYAYFSNRDYFQKIFAEMYIRKSGKIDKKLIGSGTSIVLILLPIISAQCLRLSIQRRTCHY